MVNEKKIITILSILLLIAAAAIVVMIANYKPADFNAPINDSINQQSNRAIANNTIPETKKESAKFQAISNGSDGGNVERGNYIITKASEWKDMWTKMNYDKSPIPGLPDVNFSSELVIAVFAGRKYTSGYLIEISDTDEKTNSIAVFVKEYSPGANCITLQKLTYPFYIIKTTRTEKDIGFNTEEIILNC